MPTPTDTAGFITGVYAVLAAYAALHGRGLHSFTSQLNMSRSYH